MLVHLLTFLCIDPSFNSKRWRLSDSLLQMFRRIRLSSHSSSRRTVSRASDLLPSGLVALCAWCMAFTLGLFPPPVSCALYPGASFSGAHSLVWVTPSRLWLPRKGTEEANLGEPCTSESVFIPLSDLTDPFGWFGILASMV